MEKMQQSSKKSKSTAPSQSSTRNESVKSETEEQPNLQEQVRELTDIVRQQEAYLTMYKEREMLKSKEIFRQSLLLNLSGINESLADLAKSSSSMIVEMKNLSKILMTANNIEAEK